MHISLVFTFLFMGRPHSITCSLLKKCVDVALKDMAEWAHGWDGSMVGPDDPRGILQP